MQKATFHLDHVEGGQHHSTMVVAVVLMGNSSDISHTSSVGSAKMPNENSFVFVVFRLLESKCLLPNRVVFDLYVCLGRKNDHKNQIKQSVILCLNLILVQKLHIWGKTHDTALKRNISYIDREILKAGFLECVTKHQ